MLKKRIYAISVAAGLLFGTITDLYALGDTPSAQTSGSSSLEQEIQVTAASDTFFTDVPLDSWYYPYVEYLVDSGVIKGITETTFSPAGTFTVAESAAVITRYLGLEKQAADRKYAMEILNVQGSDKWYSGYIQVMYEAGIIDVEKYGCTVQGRHIAIEDPTLLDAPVKRYEFAAFVTCSFELEGTEIGKRDDGTYIGSEFIWNGAYDESVLENYIPFIKDYNQIPSEYNYYVLKAYYNGLFIGDDNGNFNPDNSLTRAEMSKVTASIMDFSLRLHVDLSQVPDGYQLPDDSFISANGKRFLKNSVSDAILAEQAAGVTTFYENNLPYVSYLRQSVLPYGYEIEVYHFTRDKSGFDINITEDANINTSSEYKNVFTAGDRLLLVLVSTDTGEAVDALDFSLIGVDNISTDDCRYIS